MHQIRRKIRCGDVLQHTALQDFYFVEHVGRDDKHNMTYYNVRCVFKSPHGHGKLRRIFCFEVRRKDIVLSNIEEMQTARASLTVLYGKPST